ncbi:UNVERIFIED_ORG: hypothetical protein B2H98_06955 [Clostridium botulinum]
MNRKIRFKEIRKKINELEKSNLTEEEENLLQELKLVIKFLGNEHGLYLNESLSLASNVCPTCGRAL